MTVRADRVIVNACLWTNGGLVPNADAIAIAAERVVAIGPRTDVEPLLARGGVLVDAAGATVTPGLTDAHIHLVEWALARSEVTLEGASSRSAAVAAVADAVKARPGDAPIIGRGWAADSWTEAPERGALDRVSGARPVLLHSKDFHALWVNSAALAAAGVTRDTPDPPGGAIERDATGAPTGIVREHAVRLFSNGLPKPELEHALAETRTAARALLAEGVTAVHDFEGARALAVLRALARGEGPRVRVLMSLPHSGLESALALGLSSGIGDDWFRIGPLKLFADGTLGSRTAAMLEPYDGTDQHGMDLIPPAELADLVARAWAGGLAVAIHAIGDRAVRSALDAFAAASRPRAARPELPSRIEHAQLVAETDLPRFAALGVAASMQPTHCTSDQDLVERWWRTRRERSYPWRTLLASGATLAFGSDAPVESPSVARGLHAAVTRCRVGRDAPAFVPGECVTLDQALSAYTEAPARLAGQWPRVGRLAPGVAADLVVWNRNLHDTPPEELVEVHPVATLVGGEVLYQRTGESAPAAVGEPR